MRLTAQLATILRSISSDEFDDLPAGERQRIADMCRRAADLAAPRRPDLPKAGILAELRGGERAP